MRFSDIIDRYTVMKMPVNGYAGTEWAWPEDICVAGAEVRKQICKQEKKNLKRNFKAWKSPFYGRLPGWRQDTPMYVVRGDCLAGGAYVCDENEFGEPGWGQMHYNYIVPDYRGRGLFSLLFKEVMAKAVAWDLDGIMINTDRFLHPDIYQRWGAVVWKTIAK